MNKYIEHDESSDGIDRRGFLKCMAWVGSGLIWSMHGGILSSRTLAAAATGLDPTGKKPAPVGADFTFAQISDSHIGFSKEPNHDVIGTFQAAVDRLNALSVRPDLLLHTGDLTHLSKPEEFDTVSQIIQKVKTGQAFYCPGEHDFFSDDGKAYLERYGKGTMGTGWQGFTHKGVHFVGPIKNVAADRLRSLLGLTRVDCTLHPTSLAIVDSTLQ